MVRRQFLSSFVITSNN